MQQLEFQVREREARSLAQAAPSESPSLRHRPRVPEVLSRERHAVRSSMRAESPLRIAKRLRGHHCFCTLPWLIWSAEAEVSARLCDS